MNGCSSHHQAAFTEAGSLEHLAANTTELLFGHSTSDASRCEGPQTPEIAVVIHPVVMKNPEMGKSPCISGCWGSKTGRSLERC